MYPAKKTRLASQNEVQAGIVLPKAMNMWPPTFPHRRPLNLAKAPYARAQMNHLLSPPCVPNQNARKRRTSARLFVSKNQTSPQTRIREQAISFTFAFRIAYSHFSQPPSRPSPTTPPGSGPRIQPTGSTTSSPFASTMSPSLALFKAPPRLIHIAHREQ